MTHDIRVGLLPLNDLNQMLTVESVLDEAFKMKIFETMGSFYRFLEYRLFRSIEFY